MTPTHSSLRRRLRRAVALGAASALVIGSATAAVAAHTQPSNVCPPPDGGNASFNDVPSGGTFADDITCLVNYGIAEGTSTTTYAPGQDVTRGEMAKFISLLIETAQPGTLNPNAQNTFSDVSSSGIFRGYIAALAEADIVQGTGGNTYSPSAPVSRGEMAKFIANAIEAVTGSSLVDSDNTDDATNGNDDTAAFGDVNASGVFAPFINALAAEQIVEGSGGNYTPGGNVTRAEMAAFIMRSAAYADSVDLWTPTAVAPPADQTFNVTLSWINEVNADGDFRQGEPEVEGSADLIVKPADQCIEYSLDYSNLTGPFGAGPGAHLHEGPLAENGPIVVTFATGAELDAETDQIVEGTVCEGDAGFGTTVDEILATPSDYYVNIHSDAFTGGAIRGQLPDGGQDQVPPPPAAVSGIVTDVTNTNSVDTEIEYVLDGEAVTVSYAATDTFTVDGATASQSVFETAASIADELEVTESGGTQTLALTNVDSADLAAGTVGNVDLASQEFDLIEPVTGVALRADIDYTGVLYSLDGGTVVIAPFEDDLSEGDTVTITDEGETNETVALTNATVSGVLTDLTVNTGTAVNFKIDGALGDNPANGNDTKFRASATPGPGTEIYEVDGTTATYTEFETAVSEGDDVTYARSGNEETFAVTNQVPTAISGTVTETFNTGADSIDLVDGATDVQIPDYTDSSSTTYKVDGTSVTETEFEMELSAGDTVTYQPGDVPTSSVESIELTNADLTGTLDDIQLSGGVTDGDITNDTADVLNDEGGVVYDDLPFADPTDLALDPAGNTTFAYVVNGTDVTEADFETAIDGLDITTDAELDDTLSITVDGVDSAYTLTSDDV